MSEILIIRLVESWELETRARTGMFGYDLGGS